MNRIAVEIPLVRRGEACNSILLVYEFVPLLGAGHKPLVPKDKVRNRPPGGRLGLVISRPAGGLYHEDESAHPVHHNPVVRAAREHLVWRLRVRGHPGQEPFLPGVGRLVYPLRGIVLVHLPLRGLVVGRLEVSPRHVGHGVETDPAALAGVLAVAVCAWGQALKRALHGIPVFYPKRLLNPRCIKYAKVSWTNCPASSSSS